MPSRVGLERIVWVLRSPRCARQSRQRLRCSLLPVHVWVDGDEGPVAAERKGSMAVWLTALSAVAVALLGALSAYWNAQRLAQRAARLARVTAQIEHLYGPALALAETTSASFLTFRNHYRPNQRSFFGDGPPPTAEEREAWIAWVEIVFMPANLHIRDLIIANTHLLDDDDMPEPLLEFVAHVAGYEVTMASWKRGEFKELTSLIDHPGLPFQEYLRNTFKTLKHRQGELLGQR
jgi:hypothetical protein